MRLTGNTAMVVCMVLAVAGMVGTYGSCRRYGYGWATAPSLRGIEARTKLRFPRGSELIAARFCGWERSLFAEVRMPADAARAWVKALPLSSPGLDDWAAWESAVGPRVGMREWAPATWPHRMCAIAAGPYRSGGQKNVIVDFSGSKAVVYLYAFVY